MSILKFQSTHLHEVWLRDVILHKKGNVSIHTPTWGVTPKVKCTLDLSEVSIHTPTWGVTFLREYEAWLRQVSIHTPTWGVTKTLSNTWIINSFNPHTYMRCDLRGRRQQGDRHVSIHTPTWGVTGFSVRCQNQNDVSIHTPTWGVTKIIFPDPFSI